MLVLFKFGDAEHLSALRERGLLHMKTSRYFAELETNSSRGDKLEGTTRIVQPWKVRRLAFENPVFGVHDIEPNDLVGPITLSLDEEGECNIFCMFALTKPRPKPLLHPDNLGFGTSFVLVLDTQEFFDRIKSALRMQGLGGKGAPVKYFNENEYSGAVDQFMKSSRYAHQCEYRIVVRPGIHPFRELVIGNLEDITSPVLPLSDIDELVDFSPEWATGIEFE